MLRQAVTAETALVSIMLANNETGAINNIAALCSAAKAVNPRLLFHTDASQAVGKIKVDVVKLGVDLLTLAGHKLYAPKGVGAQYIRPGLVIPKFMQGPGQEQGQRGGTENVIHIVGLGRACEIAKRDFQANTQHMQQLRDSLQSQLIHRLSGMEKKKETTAGEEVRPNFCVNGPKASSWRLPNTLSISFRNLAANMLLEELKDVMAASGGAACHSDTVTVSSVLKAMSIPLEYAMGTLRLSVGVLTTQAEVDTCVEAIILAVERLSS